MVRPPARGCMSLLSTVPSAKRMELTLPSSMLWWRLGALLLNPCHHKYASVEAHSSIIWQQKSTGTIVMPKILPDGDLDLQNCQYVTKMVLGVVYMALSDRAIYLEGACWSPTWSCLHFFQWRNCHSKCCETHCTEPFVVPGITFLSGRHREEEASINLNAITKCPLLKSLAFLLWLSPAGLCTKGWKQKKTLKAGQEEYSKEP